MEKKIDNEMETGGIWGFDPLGLRRQSRLGWLREDEGMEP